MKWIINNRLKKVTHTNITKQELLKSKKILFVVYSRFGDGVIAFKIIKEFMDKYNKECFLLTSHQLLPYAKEILKDKNIIITSANKRNPFEFFGVIRKIKKFNPDIGLNPWSHGSDSEFFISFAKKFMVFKYVSKEGKTYNLYDRVRKYFFLDITQNKKILDFEIKKVNQIVITPLSTDITKNITKIDVLVSQLNKLSNNVIIATSYDLGYKKQFIFKKSKKNSQQFLHLLKNTDLLVSVDSGPLHIGGALGINTIAIFGPTAPETILDNNMKVKIIRDKKLNGIFCFVKDCKKPICIENIIDNIFNNEVKLNDNIKLKENKCPII